MRKPLSVLNDPVSCRSREVAYQMPVNCSWIWEGTMQYTRFSVQSEKFTKGVRNFSDETNEEIWQFSLSLEVNRGKQGI